MVDLLVGLLIGAMCIAIPAFVYGFVTQWRKDMARIHYQEFTKLLDDFDREYSRYSKTPAYKEQLAKFKESNGGS